MPDEIEDALMEFNRIVARDGGAIREMNRDMVKGELVVSYAPGDSASCEACVLSREGLESLLEGALVDLGYISSVRVILADEGIGGTTLV